MYVPSSVQFLIEAGRWAPSADNTQPWEFFWDGDHQLVVGHSKRLQHSFPSDHPATLMAMGAVAENVFQAATALGIPISLAHSSGSGVPRFEFEVGLHRTDLYGPRDHPVFVRHTNRLRYDKKALPVALLDRVGKLTELTARVVVTTDQDRIREVARLAQMASEVRFQTRENHDWFHASLCLRQEKAREGYGLDVATLDLPPGGALMLRVLRDWRRMSLANRARAYAFFAHVEAMPLGRAPAIVAIVGPRGFLPTLAAGRLLQRVWLELNASGLAVQPFYVVSEQLHRLQGARVLSGFEDRIRLVHKETVSLLGLQNETLHMLLRVGWPLRNPVRSRRLPLQTVLNTHRI